MRQWAHSCVLCAAPLLCVHLSSCVPFAVGCVQRPSFLLCAMCIPCVLFAVCCVHLLGFVCIPLVLCCVCIFCVLGSAPLPLLAVSLSLSATGRPSFTWAAHCNKWKTLECRKTKIHNYHKFSLEDEAEVTTNRDKQSQEVRKINLYSTQL